MNRNIDLIDYLKWADKHISNSILKLDQQELDKSLSEGAGSIFQKVKHIAEEYTAWLMDIQSKSWKVDIEKISKMRIDDLINQMEFQLDQWIDFIKKNMKNKFIIDENEFKVPISLDQVVFNLVNHSSYHRGQIALLLRSLGYEVNITDYYWYQIYLQNLQ